MRELDQRLLLEAELADRWLTESYSVLGRIVTTDDLRPALDPGISAYLEAVRDYLIVADTGGRVLALSEVARALRASDSGAADRRCSTPSAPTSRPAISPSRRVGQVPLPGHARWPTRARRWAGSWWPHRSPRSRSGRRTCSARCSSSPRSCSSARGSWAIGWPAPACGRCRASWTSWRRSATGGASTAGSRCRCPRDEIARLALGVNRMLARLEVSFASLHRFTADASHELKTPLMVLRAGVERALVHPGDAERGAPVAGRDPGADQPDVGDGGEPAHAGPRRRGAGAARGRGQPTSATSWATWRRPRGCWARRRGSP